MLAVLPRSRLLQRSPNQSLTLGVCEAHLLLLKEHASLDPLSCS